MYSRIKSHFQSAQFQRKDKSKLGQLNSLTLDIWIRIMTSLETSHILREMLNELPLRKTIGKPRELRFGNDAYACLFLCPPRAWIPGQYSEALLSSGFKRKVHVHRHLLPFIPLYNVASTRSCYRKLFLQKGLL